MSRVVARHEPCVLGQFGPSPHGELTSRVSIRRSGPNHLPPQGMAMCGRRRKVLRPDRPHPRPTRDPLRTDQNGLFSSPVPRWLLGSRTAVLLLTGPLLVVYNAEKVADNSQLLVNVPVSLTHLFTSTYSIRGHAPRWLVADSRRKLAETIKAETYNYEDWVTAEMDVEAVKKVPLLRSNPNPNP